MRQFFGHIFLILFLGGVVGLIWTWRSGKAIEGVSEEPQKIDMAELEAGDVEIKNKFIELGPHVRFYKAGYFTHEKSYEPGNTGGESKSYAITEHQKLKSIRKDIHNNRIVRFCYPVVSTSHPLTEKAFSNNNSPEWIDGKSAGNLPTNGPLYLICVENRPNMTVGDILNTIKYPKKHGRYVPAARGIVSKRLNVHPSILKNHFPGVDPDKVVAFKLLDDSWTPDLSGRKTYQMRKWLCIAAIIIGIIGGGCCINPEEEENSG